MSAIHGDPEQHGVTFGDVVVTVDLGLGDCVIRAPQPGLVLPVEKRARFHSLDEMRGAYAVQQGIHQKDPNNTTARDMAKALKFAGLAIKTHQKGSK